MYSMTVCLTVTVNMDVRNVTLQGMLRQVCLHV